MSVPVLVLSSASGCARAAAGALGPRGAASGAAQRQQLLQSLLQVWQCGFTLYMPPPGGPRPRPRASRSSSSAAFLPPARPLARSLGAGGGGSAKHCRPWSSRKNKIREQPRPVRRPAGGRAWSRGLRAAAARRAGACAAAGAAAARLGGGGDGGSAGL